VEEVSRWGSGCDAGKPVAEADHEGREVARIPIAGAINTWSGEATPQPTEAGMVDPNGDVDLVAGEEGDGSADAMNSWAVREVLLEVEAEALLGAAAEAENDVGGSALLKPAEESVVLKSGAIHGGEIDVIVGEVNAVFAEPGHVAACGFRIGHHPKARTGTAKLVPVDEGAKVAEAGELGNVVVLDEVPEDNHKSAVCDGKVGAEERVPIAFIVSEVFESRRSGNNDEATVAGDLVDGIVSSADEESDSQYLLKADFRAHLGSLLTYKREFYPVVH
jgi:hypothetical protein